MERISLLCCKSCLKGGDNKEYYELLGIENPASADADAIKKAYKTISLSLHPDKLAQRGIKPSQDQQEKFIKVRINH